MGKLIDGKWNIESIITCNNYGEYERIPRTFLDTISNEHKTFKPESNRYHLYVSYACPWATRTLIYRQLKDLDRHIGVSIVHPDMLEDGWKFDQSFPGATKDHLYGKSFLREIYQKADKFVTSSVTVPVLWDKKTETIVNNESSHIIRIFNSNFNKLTGNQNNYFPKDKQTEIEEMNKLIYESINNGVYKSGFALTQKAYEKAVIKLFEVLEQLDKVLSKSKYLIENTLTEADLRLIPTLLRFDCVYVTHFKCNIKRIIDFKNLHRYMEDLLQIPAIKNTFFIDHIKRHYFCSHKSINPYKIIPVGPIDF
ncbi:MAG: glutathione-dependent reductase [Rickettsiales bacterium]|nr:glutathione-dependent reductase [Rickettsiales bacterium]